MTEALPPVLDPSGPLTSDYVDELALLKRAALEHATLLGDKVTFDFKEVLTYARYARAAGRRLWTLIREFRPEVLIAPGFGGAPLLYATAFAAQEMDGVDLPVWMVRDQRKTYYRKRWVEGPMLPDGVRAAYIDDFLGQGSSIELIDQAVAADKRPVQLVVIGVLFDQWEPLGSRQLSLSRCPVRAVLKRHDIGLSRDCWDALPPQMTGAAPAFLQKQHPLWWRFEFNGFSDLPFKSSPVIADNAVFAADDQARVWRFDGITGEAQWCRESLAMPLKGIVQRLQCVDGSIVYGCYDGTVTRLDARTGELLWRWRVDSHVHSTPVVDLAQQRLFINTEQGNWGEPRGHCYALDWRTGRVLWRHDHGFWPPATPSYDATSDAVVTTCNDQSISCLDASSGRVRWAGRTQGLVRGQAAIEDGVVLVATEEGFLQKFDLRSGELLLTRRHGRGLLHQFLYVAGGVAFTLDGGYNLIALDVQDFRTRWLSRLRSPGVWCPVPFGRYLVVLSQEGHLAVLDPSLERKVWEGSVGGDYRQAPAFGRVNGRPVMACASQQSGLKLFEIDSFYDLPFL